MMISYDEIKFKVMKIWEFIQKHKLELLTVFSLPILGLAFFIINFSSHGLSNDITQWGQFGDYFNWIISWFIGSANLVLLYRLTLIARVFNKEDTAKQASYEFIKNIITSIDQNKDLMLASLSVSSWDINNLDRFKQHWYLLTIILGSAKGELKILLDMDADKVNLSEIQTGIDNCKAALDTLLEEVKKPNWQSSVSTLIGDIVAEISKLKILLYKEIKRL
jgi:hypothetical protein